MIQEKSDHHSQQLPIAWSVWSVTHHETNIKEPKDRQEGRNNMMGFDFPERHQKHTKNSWQHQLSDHRPRLVGILTDCEHSTGRYETKERYIRPIRNKLTRETNKMKITRNTVPVNTNDIHKSDIKVKLWL
jgi:hypothetical protein